MSKIIGLLIAAALLCKLLSNRWPWQLMALPPKPAAATPAARARALLQLSPTATRADIVEAHRRLIFRVHPDRGGSAAQAHQANAARDLLLAALPPGHPIDPLVPPSAQETP